MENRSSQKVELGDKINYAIKGIMSTYSELELNENIHLNNILYVPSLKKNLISLSCLEYEGDRVEFVDGKVLAWPKGSSIYVATLI